MCLQACAFVTFRTSAGFQAAVRANPHTIADDEIYVEERKTRTGLSVSSDACNERVPDVAGAGA